MTALLATSLGGPARWSAVSIEAVLSGPGGFACRAQDGALLGRAIAGEAEILTLAVAPAARRSGIARGLLAEFAKQATARGAETAFLEVAGDNAPARALYAADGWYEVGRRRGYYAGTDALILRKAF